MRIFALLLLCTLLGALKVPAVESRPNILFVLFDDLGWGQPESYNADSALRTPNLDRLARQGMRFTDAHAAAAVCTPTRYGVLTGRYPSRIGQFGVLTTFSLPIIPTSRLTVASLLRQHDYATACIGKWHLGIDWLDGEPGSQSSVPVGAKIHEGPNALGFDYFYGFTHARNIGTVIEQDQVVANVEPVENQPMMIRKAVEWMGQRDQDKPFFLYFPMCPPHEPLVPSPDYIGKSGAKDLVKKSPVYGDWVYQGDAMLGQLLEALEFYNLADNTLVIATADNGAAGRSYEPLRASKSSIYEGGHRVPYVVRWPGKVEPGSVNDHTICLNDLMATVAEIVGGDLPDDAGEDSISLVAEFLGTAETPVREVTVHQAPSGDLAIRKGPWKMVFLKAGPPELYNLDTDLSEACDVISTHPDIAAELTAVLQRIIKRGRSTPGEVQTNDFELALPDGKGKAKRKNKKKRNSDPSV